MKTSKKRRSGIVLSMFLVMALLSLGAISQLEAKTITLRFATFHSPIGPEGEAPKYLMDEITKRTHGQIQFEEYFSGSLLKARELLKGIQMGSADMGFILPPYFPRELGILSILQPFLRGPISNEKKLPFFDDFFNAFPEADAEIEKWNQKRIAVHLFGRLSVGSHVPLKSLEGFKGLKIRSPSGYTNMWLKCLGANTVFLKSSDVYSAFEKKAIDAVFTSITAQCRSKWYETSKPYYILIIPMFSELAPLITINLDKWNSLSPDMQKIISEAGRDYSRFLIKRIEELEHEYLGKMKAEGVVFAEVSAENVTGWSKKCEKEAITKWIEQANKLGLAGDRLMDRMMQFMDKHTQ